MLNITIFFNYLSKCFTVSIPYPYNHSMKRVLLLSSFHRLEKGVPENLHKAPKAASPLWGKVGARRQRRAILF